MRFDIITIFPRLFDSFLSESLIAKAQKRRLINIRVHNLRDWAKDKHKTVDDRPYGGGPGMILKAQPIYDALKSIISQHPKFGLLKKSKIVVLDPAGKQFNQRMAEKFSKLDRLIFLCGRYEGFDARVTKFVDERVSVGPYVLSGGEVPAMVIIEAVSRLIPGFVGKPESLKEETFAKQVTGYGLQVTGFMEYPQYTRPEIFKCIVRDKKRELKVPKVLLSGNHKKIEEWRKKYTKMIKPTTKLLNTK